MRIVTWNVNSIRVRERRVADWLVAHAPDALCLQETKVVDDQFPLEAIEAAGYRAVIHGQKTYNGVAILTKEEVTDVVCGFGDDTDEAGARLIAATVNGVRVVSVYIPNGKTVGSEHYERKIAWLARLESWVRDEIAKGLPLTLCGDFNIAPEARDVHDVSQWEGSVLFNDAMRDTFARLLGLGLVDTFRLHREESGLHSWWDYRMLAFPKNLGLRIDFVLATSALADSCSDAFIDRDQRKTKACPEGTKASDHAPAVADFDI